MEFGRLPIEQIDQVDFTLPPDPALNATVLPGKPGRGKIYLGMPKWGRTEWVGKLYPNGTKEKDFLSQYVHHFNAVELNATHYKLYPSGTIAKWADQAKGRDFRFCPKLYQGITHRSNLAGKDFLLSEFVKGVEAFGEHLGPIFIQLSDKFSARRNQELFSFLESLPGGKQFFVELRHPGWFEHTELFNFLQSKGIGSVISDTAGRRDAAHMHLTIPKTMIRFIGNDHPSDAIRIDAWVKRLQIWQDQGIDEIYFFLHAKEEGHVPEFIQYVIKRFNEVCTAELPLLFL